VNGKRPRQYVLRYKTRGGAVSGRPYEPIPRWH